MKRLTLLFLMAAEPAMAHHVMNGQPMETFSDGLLSGFGHPVLGFDHLFFVLAVGLVARLAGLPFRGPMAYLSAMLAGCLLRASGTELPLTEVAVALSLIVSGGLLARGRLPQGGVLLALFAGFGLFHGAALGASITWQEARAPGPVLVGYLLGLGTIQYALSVGAGLAGRRLGAVAATEIPARLAGAMIAGVGVFLVLEQVEASVLEWVMAST